MPKTVTIFGSTGVIGTKTLEVLSHLGDAYEVVALAAGSNVKLLAQQIQKYSPAYVSVQDDQAYKGLKELLPKYQKTPEIGVGEKGLLTGASLPSDVVVSGIVGARGLLPTWEAVKRGATIALANKETLVAAGDLVMPFATQQGSQIVPVDSEHSALFQCMLAGRREEVTRYIVTASGGPFRTWSEDELSKVTVEQALRHPNWAMGRKITVDSATLMNKGLEVIEAHHLFRASYSNIDVIVHPQSVIHSMVEFRDGSIIAQLGMADMSIPIQFALTYPERISAPWPKLDLLKMNTLTFESPDTHRFRSLKLAYDAGVAGGYAPCVLNAANEIAVEAFLEERISFLDIPRLVESVLNLHPGGMPTAITDIIEVDAWSRRTAKTLLSKGGWNG